MASRRSSDPSSSTPPTSKATILSETGKDGGEADVAAVSPSPLLPEKRLQIVMDTREQRGWTFEPRQVSVTRKALPAGDYSLLGLEARVALERKALGDFVNTVIHDWLRFRKELVRLSGYDVAAVCVEADVGQIYRHEYESDASPASVLGRANAIFLDHGTPVLFWGDRKSAADMAHRLLLAAWRRFHDAGLDDVPG